MEVRPNSYGSMYAIIRYLGLVGVLLGQVVVSI